MSSRFNPRSWFGGSKYAQEKPKNESEDDEDDEEPPKSEEEEDDEKEQEQEDPELVVIDKPEEPEEEEEEEEEKKEEEAKAKVVVPFSPKRKISITKPPLSSQSPRSTIHPFPTFSSTKQSALHQQQQEQRLFVQSKLKQSGLGMSRAPPMNESELRELQNLGIFGQGEQHNVEPEYYPTIGSPHSSSYFSSSSSASPSSKNTKKTLKRARDNLDDFVRMEHEQSTNTFIERSDKIRKLWLQEHPATPFLKDLAGSLKLKDHSSLLNFTTFDQMQEKMKQLLIGETKKQQKKQLHDALIERIKDLTEVITSLGKTARDVNHLFINSTVLMDYLQFMNAEDNPWISEFKNLAKLEQPVLNELSRSRTEIKKKKTGSSDITRRKKQEEKTPEKDIETTMEEQEKSTKEPFSKDQTDDKGRFHSSTKSDLLMEIEDKTEKDWTNFLNSTENNKFGNSFQEAYYMAMHPFVFPNSPFYPDSNSDFVDELAQNSIENVQSFTQSFIGKQFERSGTESDGSSLLESEYRRKIFRNYYYSIGIRNLESNRLSLAVPKYEDPNETHFLFLPFFFRSKFFFKLVLSQNNISLRLKYMFLFYMLLVMGDLVQEWSLTDMGDGQMLLLHLGYCILTLASYLDFFYHKRRLEENDATTVDDSDFQQSTVKEEEEWFSIFGPSFQEILTIEDRSNNYFIPMALSRPYVKDAKKSKASISRFVKSLSENYVKGSSLDSAVNTTGLAEHYPSTPGFSTKTLLEARILHLSNLVFINHISGLLLSTMGITYILDIFVKSIQFSRSFWDDGYNINKIKEDYEYLIELNFVGDSSSSGGESGPAVNLFSNQKSKSLLTNTIYYEDRTGEKVRVAMGENDNVKQVNPKFLWLKKVERFLTLSLPSQFSDWIATHVRFGNNKFIHQNSHLFAVNKKGYNFDQEELEVTKNNNEEDDDNDKIVQDNKDWVSNFVEGKWVASSRTSAVEYLKKPLRVLWHIEMWKIVHFNEIDNVLTLADDARPIDEDASVAKRPVLQKILLSIKDTDGEKRHDSVRIVIKDIVNNSFELDDLEPDDQKGGLYYNTVKSLSSSSVYWIINDIVLTFSSIFPKSTIDSRMVRQQKTFFAESIKTFLTAAARRGENGGIKKRTFPESDINPSKHFPMVHLLKEIVDLFSKNLKLSNRGISSVLLKSAGGSEPIRKKQKTKHDVDAEEDEEAGVGGQSLMTIHTVMEDIPEILFRFYDSTKIFDSTKVTCWFSEISLLKAAQICAMEIEKIVPGLDQTSVKEISEQFQVPDSYLAYMRNPPQLVDVLIESDPIGFNPVHKNSKDYLENIILTTRNWFAMWKEFGLMMERFQLLLKDVINDLSSSGLLTPSDKLEIRKITSLVNEPEEEEDVAVVDIEEEDTSVSKKRQNTRGMTVSENSTNLEQIENQFWTILENPSKIWINVAENLNQSNSRIQDFVQNFESLLPVTIEKTVLTNIFSGFEAILDFYKSHHLIRNGVTGISDENTYDRYGQVMTSYNNSPSSWYSKEDHKLAVILSGNYYSCSNKNSGGPHLFLYCNNSRVLALFSKIIASEIIKMDRRHPVPGPYVQTKVMKWTVIDQLDCITRLATNFIMSGGSIGGRGGMMDMESLIQYSESAQNTYEEEEEQEGRKKRKRGYGNGKKGSTSIVSFQEGEEMEDVEEKDTVHHVPMDLNMMKYNMYGPISESILANSSSEKVEDMAVLLLHAGVFRPVDGTY